jgi:hypothetical protein
MGKRIAAARAEVDRKHKCPLFLSVPPLVPFAAFGEDDRLPEKGEYAGGLPGSKG